MTFSTYAGLQAEIATWLRRTDLTDSIPGFISLAESAMNRRIRCQRMVTRATATLDAATAEAPDDFLAPRALTIVGEAPLEWVSSERMDDLLATYDYTSGQPRHYTLEGGAFRISPTPDTSYSAALSYYAAPAALSDSNTSNWILASHPDAYLYGALMQSAPYLRADDRVTMWASMFAQVIEDINNGDAGLGGSLGVLPSTYGAGAI